MSLRQSVTVAGSLLDEHDRRVLEVWSGMVIPPQGDVNFFLTDEQKGSLDRLLEMLGK